MENKGQIAQKMERKQDKIILFLDLVYLVYSVTLLPALKLCIVVIVLYVLNTASPNVKPIVNSTIAFVGFLWAIEGNYKIMRGSEK